MKKSLVVLLAICILTFISCKGNVAEADSEPYVIMVSYDGMRHDYVEKFDAINFKEFIHGGSSAESMTPSFPSKTFPNHYTMVTGLYPGNHGLVDNTFLDKDREQLYRIGNRTVVEDPYYYGGLPLWQLAQQNDMKSASYFWVGSEAEINGSFPDYYHIYDGSIPNETRIDTVIGWLNLPKKDRPRFMTLYFSLLDDQGHATGPNAAATGAAVQEADRLLGLLMEGVNSSALNVNVILTSDHGMYEMVNQPEAFIYAEDILEGIDEADYTFIRNGTHAHMYVDNQDVLDDAYELIKGREDRFKIYHRDETPEHWHYRDNERIGDLLLVAEPGSNFTTRERQTTNPETRQVWGVHGFDPYVTPDMGAIFYAHGPNIKEGLEIPAFENIHIYPFVAQLLGIDVLPDIDGDASVLSPLLKD